MKSNGKIFVIGFNKTATRSFHDFFVKNGLKGVHWKDGDLAIDIAKNISSFQDPISGYEEFDVFSDIECVTRKDKPCIEGYKYFKSFFQWHPESKFILNTRNIEDWLKSRERHAGGLYLDWYKYHYALDKEKVLEQWRLDYYHHHFQVLDFFKDKPASLLTYDIDRHEPSRLVDFFGGRCDLNPGYFGHVGKTQ
ncbi:sulfotransferase [Salinicola sp. NYA28a]